MSIAWTPPNDKRSWLSAAEAEKLYEPKGYPRGEVDYRIRTENEYPSTPEMLAIRIPPTEKLAEKKARLEAEARPGFVVTEGREVPLDRVLKYTKANTISTQSMMGKIASTILDLGGEVKAGESVYYTGDVVKPVNVMIEGRQTPQTMDYVIDIGQKLGQTWLEARLNGYRITVTGSQIIANGIIRKWDREGGLKEEILK